jgi:transcriptional regulator with XRE-family HTH domain
MRTPAQRGRYGQWLVAARQAKGYETATKALQAMAAAGIAIGKSTYAEYESGSKAPSKNHLPLLEAFWGPAPEVNAEPTDQTDLVVAIRELVDEMRLSRAQQDESTQALLRAVAAVLPSTQGRPGTSGDTGLEAPAGTGR